MFNKNVMYLVKDYYELSFEISLYEDTIGNMSVNASILLKNFIKTAV